MTAEGFEQLRVNTITQQITFPSALDYVRFQLIATPMASLLGDRTDSERETAIRDIAIEAEALLDKDILRDGRLSFPQQAYVASAVR